MRRLPNQFLPILVLLPLVGCGFSPGAPGEASGTGGGTGAGSGAAGTIGNNLGAGLAGSDVVLSGTGGTSTTCGQAAVTINPLPPDILIVEDRSGSMNDDQTDTPCNGGCGAMSKWALVTAAINQVAMGTDTMVNWGLKFFADADAQCGVNAGVAVGIAARTSGAIATAITASTSGNGGVMNGSYTPTRKAVNAGDAYLMGLKDTNPKYLLLATDGLPNCPDNCTGNACTNTPNAAETAAVEASITAAQADGFKTFVVGIATGTDPSANTALNGFAMAGGEAQPGGATQYYSVTDTASLVTALNKIVGIIASCTIDVSKVPTDALANFKISATDANGNPVEITDYTFDPMGTGAPPLPRPNNIILDPNGVSCMSLGNGSYKNFQFNYACAGAKVCIDKNADGTCAGQ
jgi:hypothetical protein